MNSDTKISVQFSLPVVGVSANGWTFSRLKVYVAEDHFAR